VAARTLSERQLNRAMLARQGLLERSARPLPAMLARMGGLQAQYAPSMYVGLWSRLAGLERAAVTRGLERRRLVQGTLLRATIHLVPREAYWPWALAVRDARRALWLRAHRGAPTAAAMEDAAGALRRALADGPLWRKEIEAVIGRPATPGINLWLDLVRVPPSGTWEHRAANRWGLAEDWIGPPEPGLTVAAARERLVREYLAAFGPASRHDVASWTGLPLREVDDVLAGITLREFVTEDGTPLADLPRLPLPDPDTPAPVRFLPTFDAALLAHARRTGIVPEATRPRIFHTKRPQSIGTVLVDGAVRATWWPEDGGIATEALEPAGEDPGVAAEAAALAAFAG
jgi:hypothetical protein